MQEQKQFKTIKASSLTQSNVLERQATYHVNGKSFVVTPVFRSDTSETLGSVLVKLMRGEHSHTP